MDIGPIGTPLGACSGPKMTSRTAPLSASVCHGGSLPTIYIKEAGHGQLTTISFDLAKNVFQVQGVDASVKVAQAALR